MRRLDDILEALEQMNLNEITRLSHPLEERLKELGIEDPRGHSVAHLIEKVWAHQQPFLIQVVTERRRRRRRRTDADIMASSSNP